MRMTTVLLLFSGMLTVARADEIRRLNNQFFRTVEQEAFDGYGDVSYWSKRAKELAFHAAEHVARVSMEMTSGRSFDPATRAARFKEIAALNQQFVTRAKSWAFDGYGDVDYWSKRAKRFSVEIAMHAANVAAQCDQEMAGAARPQLEALLADGHTAGFAGYGDVSYWSHRAKQLATRIAELANQMNTSLVAAVVP